jgi:hypothetical protein
MTPTGRPPGVAPVKRDSLARHLLIAGLITAAVYFGLFQLNEWLRTRRGAWEVVFTAENGAPTITIVESRLKIGEVKLLFPGETTPALAAPVAWRFDDVSKTNLPFGAVIFHDLTYLPGTVTMNLFGHEIELLPRTLGVNRREVAWEAGRTVTLQPGEKLPPDPAPKKPERY